MVRRAQLLTCACLFFLATTASLAKADPITVFSNFGPGMSFDSDVDSGWTVNGFLSSDVGQQVISHRFTSSANYLFTKLELPLSRFQGDGSVSLYLQSDAAGVPGSVLERMNVVAISLTPTLLSAKSADHTALMAGESYWLTAVAGPGVIAGWNWNVIGDVSNASNFASNQLGTPAGPWALDSEGPTRGAFRIQGAPQPAAIPEPATIVLIGSGLAALALPRARRRSNYF
jgi:hypothetical protein